MAQPNLEIPCYASSPFNDSDGDLILRSSDGVDFRVFGVILRLASPFFASMLEVGRASHAAADVSHPGGDVVRDGCPVVPVQEDSNTLDLLLRIVYPVKDPVLDDLARLQSVVAAALKYDMEEAIALSSMTLLSFAPQKAFSVWAIAVRNRLEVEARAAADEINRQQISVLENFPPAMQEVNAGSYYRLLQYLSLKGQVGENFEFCCPPIIQANSRLAAPSSNASPASNEKVLLYLQGLAVEARQERIRRSESLSDVICRSSDGQEFLAVKAFLAFASPVIAAMVTDTVIPRTRDAGDESVASNANTDLTFEEDGDTLRALIDLCYPDAGDDAQEYLTLPGIHDAVEKYGMKNAREILQREWSQLMPSDPLRAYLLAARHKRSADALKAAERLLDRSMEEYHVPAMESSPASTYRNALLYHRACKDAACDVARLVRSKAGPGGGSEGDFVVPRSSTQCIGVQVYGNKGRSCLGSANYLVNPDIRNRCCIPCTLLGTGIAHACERLESPSAELFTAMDWLRNPSLASNPVWPSSSYKQDHLAMRRLYKAMYDEVILKVNQASTQYIVIQPEA